MGTSRVGSGGQGACGKPWGCVRSPRWLEPAWTCDTQPRPRPVPLPQPTSTFAPRWVHGSPQADLTAFSLGSQTASKLTESMLTE